MLHAQQTADFVAQFWDQDIVPPIIDYIRIPNKSPYFQPDWEEAGHMEAALQLALKWIEAHPLPGAKLHLGRLPGRTPLILIDVPGDLDQTVLLYGHLDKQPEMSGWREDLGPWKPVYEDGKLYGRGGADDGYALFASVCALKALHQQGVKHARCVIVIEFSEESGSPDLPPYMDHFKDIIGAPDLVVCLDSGAGNYDQLWSTTSLRGMLGGTVRVDVLDEGVHSGSASGVVPSSFRIIRQLLSRIEDPETGSMPLPEFNAPIPQQRRDQAEKAAQELGAIEAAFPFVDGVKPMASDAVENILNRTWRPTLSVIGQEGLPPSLSGGNVLRPFTELKLSLRLPPTTDSKEAQNALKRALTENPPYGAKVALDFEKGADGWNAPELAPWLDDALNEASTMFYGKQALHMGEGGSIPFMGMLGDQFPQAQFVITGVLGPNSNAHGPNEFLHVPYAKKLTCCVAQILARHAARI